MSPASQNVRQLDQLIDEITVDCHDGVEQLMGFESAFDEEANFPCPVTVVGAPVKILHIGRGGCRRELIATCERAGKRYEIALLDVDIHDDPNIARLLAGYRRWTALAA